MSEVGEREPLLPPVDDSNLEDQKRKAIPGTTASRFLKYALAGFLFIFAFSLVFFPRTSLRRDLNRIHGEWLPEAEVERLLIDAIDPKDLREWSKNYTRKEHLAGDGKDLADWTNDFFNENGFRSEVVPYYTYLNRPVANGVSVLNKDGSVKFKASLKEDVLEEDPTSGNADSVPVFHGYSASGNVTAKFVYANYGTVGDFASLEKLGVNVTGKIAVIRYGKIFRGLKVKHAQHYGAVGVLIFTDPTDDFGVDFAHGYKAYPKGPARNPSSVQRGSVMYLSDGPGDPTTPGYASTIDADRKDPSHVIPQIPSIPISYAEAIPILKELNGLGPGPSDFEEDWGGILEEVSYNVGPSKLEINLFNDQDYSIKPIFNVIAHLDGVLPGQAVVVGNHRDAWISGGAGDPNSGSAALLALAKALGSLKARGWRPLRTIILASWDGEEYALLGSTEWGEDKAQFLSKNALAYVNLDVGVSGSRFSAEASPSLNELIRNATRRVEYPTGGSLHKKWKEQAGGDGIGTLGTGSDYTVFLDHLGIPSIDIGFGQGPGDAVYQYHSNYDSFHWMDTFVDPDWKLHATVSKLLSLLTVSLADRAVADLHFKEYGLVLKKGLDGILKKYPLEELSQHQSKSSVFEAIQSLYAKIDEFTIAGAKLDTYTDELSDAFTRDWPWYKLHKKVLLLFKIHKVNYKLAYVERTFLHAEGLENRAWFKHALFAPDRYLGYGGAVFPGVLESLQDSNPAGLVKWVAILKDILDGTIKALEV